MKINGINYNYYENNIYVFSSKYDWHNFALTAGPSEKDLEAEVQEKSPKAALTELFLELKTDQTPAVVERIVADIDAIVRVVSFPGWQKTTSGEREVQKSLRQALLKYQLHKDQVLFDRAYSYIKEYY
jgi:type I restriction enzyme R subunit